MWILVLLEIALQRRQFVQEVADATKFLIGFVFGIYMEKIKSLRKPPLASSQVSLFRILPTSGSSILCVPRDHRTDSGWGGANLSIVAVNSAPHHSATAKQYCPFSSTVARHCTNLCDVAAD